MGRDGDAKVRGSDLIRALAVILGYQAVVLLAICVVPQLAAAAGSVTITTFEDGSEAKMISVPGCGWDNSSVAISLWPLAPVLSASVRFGSQNDTGGSGVNVDIGGDGTIDYNNNVSFPSTINLTAAPFNVYLAGAGNASSNVTVPIHMQVCTWPQAGVSFQMDDLRIGIQLPEEPMVRSILGPLELTNGTIERGALDVSEIFDSADHARLTYSVFEDAASNDNGTLPVKVVVNGTRVDVDATLDIGWAGTYYFLVEACDSFRQCARTDPIRVDVVSAQPPGDGTGGEGSARPVPRILVVGASNGTALETTSLNVSLAWDGLPPEGLTVSWRVDGLEAGSDPALNGLTLLPGPHVLEASYAFENETGVVSRFLSVVALPAARTPSVADRSTDDAVIATFAAITLTASLAASPMVRFSFLWIVIGALMGRMRKEGLLDHFVRGRIYQLVADAPGIHFSELVRRLDLGNGNAIYHLRVLQRAGFLRIERGPRFTRMFLSDAEVGSAGYGLNGTQQAVLQRVIQAPGVAPSQIASDLDVSPSTVSRCAAHLRRLGLVRIRVAGRRSSLWPGLGAGSASLYLAAAGEPVPSPRDQAPSRSRD